MTTEQFSAYFERVFRYHNRVMNDLINYSADRPEDSDDNRAISEAEATMVEACELLNDVVAAESVSEHVDFRTKRQLPQAVPECEAATQHLEVLLLEVSKAKGIATHFLPQ